MKTYPFTQDEALRPVKMTCVNCKAEMTVYCNSRNAKIVRIGKLIESMTRGAMDF